MVVPIDLTFLREICGPNDTNLRVIEGLVDDPVRIRGNELFLETNNDMKQKHFAGLLEWLCVQVRKGQIIDKHVINTAFQAVTLSDHNLRASISTPIVLPGGRKEVYARSVQQGKYLDALKENELVVVVGPAGSGKTYLAVASALSQVLRQLKQRLVMTRPVVEAGEKLGFLPGDLTQKIDPYLRPLYDAIDSLVPADVLRHMEDIRAIEIAPLAYMRGRTIANCCVILDEAQNTTRQQMKMFLTRLGEGSRAIITGDITQIDLPRREDSGLVHIISVLSSVKDAKFIHMGKEDVVRSELVRQVVQAYEIAEQISDSSEANRTVSKSKPNTDDQSDRVRW